MIKLYYIGTDSELIDPFTTFSGFRKISWLEKLFTAEYMLLNIAHIRTHVHNNLYGYNNKTYKILQITTSCSLMPYVINELRAVLFQNVLTKYISLIALEIAHKNHRDIFRRKRSVTNQRDSY